MSVTLEFTCEWCGEAFTVTRKNGSGGPALTCGPSCRYQRAKAKKDARRAVCAEEGCAKVTFSRGWCQMHYARWLRHGDPSTTKQPGRESGVGSKDGRYVWVKAPGHPLADRIGWVAEHRMVAWDHGILADPADHVHHINHNKHDNRPENLEALSASDHMALHAAELTHCKRGHEYTPENCKLTSAGFRQCMVCRRITARASYWRKRGAA